MAPPVAIGPTASGLLQNLPFQTVNPFAPAGLTDATRQGWYTGLQGLGAQYGPAQQYAQGMGGLQQMGQSTFLGGLGSGQFASNPLIRGSAGLVGNALGQYGGGWSGGLANQINRTGASFDPFNNPALGAAISEANQRLGRDFQQNVMPALNRAATGAGPGAYGGTRAGVAQGIREQGLADAMQRQTTDMLSRGYEAGLGRYVQDRGQTLDATLRALQQGGTLGMQGARLLGDLGLGGLGEQNRMFQFGYGRLLPQGLQNAYQAALQPGNVMQQFGNQLTGIGGQQQAQNQAYIDWMNSQAAQNQDWPWQQFGRYQASVSPITARPGTQQTIMGPAANPWQRGLQGAGVGLTLWDQFGGMFGGGPDWGGSRPLGQSNITGTWPE